MRIKIREILSRSEQGVTRPFFCRGDDGRLYYVKGRGAGRRALISEWLAGHLGQRLGLPIPDFALAEVPVELVEGSARDDISELGAGVGFASRMVEDANELTFLYIEQIDVVVRAEILLFDWWTANGDRTLTEHGGNPNLLWVYRQHRAHVIDHNLAFDESALEQFWSEHIFAASGGLWTEPFREKMKRRMTGSMEGLEHWWNEMPHEWTEVESGITLEGARNLLWRFERDPAIFWRRE